MNFKENKAIYLQIAESICDEILLGTYAEEERIPSVREYASTMEVNSNTVMRSYDWLQQQEIIFTKEDAQTGVYEKRPAGIVQKDGHTGHHN